MNPLNNINRFTNPIALPLPNNNNIQFINPIVQLNAETKAFLQNSNVLASAQLYGTGANKTRQGVGNIISQKYGNLSTFYGKMQDIASKWKQYTRNATNAEIASRDPLFNEFKQLISRAFVITENYHQKIHFIPRFVKALAQAQIAASGTNSLTGGQQRRLNEANNAIATGNGFDVPFVSDFGLTGAKFRSGGDASLTANWGRGNSLYSQGDKNFMTVFLDIAFNDPSIVGAVYSNLIADTLINLLRDLKNRPESVASIVADRLGIPTFNVEGRNIVNAGNLRLANNEILVPLSRLAENEQVRIAVSEIRNRLTETIKEIDRQGKLLASSTETYERIRVEQEICLSNLVVAYVNELVQVIYKRVSDAEVAIGQLIPAGTSNQIATVLDNLVYNSPLQLDVGEPVSTCITQTMEKVQAHDVKITEYMNLVRQLENQLVMVSGALDEQQ